MGAGPERDTADAERLHDNIRLLAQFGARSSGGIDRQTFSRPYRDAVNWLSARFTEAGLRVREDSAGNLIGRIGPDGPCLICGSHIDTVPGGGAYDGALGVLAGLECARRLKHEEGVLAYGFEVVAFADEEGSFVSLLGSRAMRGLLSQAEIDRARSRKGVELTAALEEYGLDPLAVLDARRPPADIAGYIELHIEQGPVLESAGTAIGIVEAVVGISVGRHELIGLANHSGTTPMAARRDALRTAAVGIAGAYEAVASGIYPDTVLNFGQLSIEPGATNVVPRRVVLTQEIRSTRKERIQQLQEACEAAFSRSARQLGVEHIWRQDDVDPPAIMAGPARQRIADACSELGISAMTMPSGAGHDAQLFADICPTGMIFVPSRGGISHNPAEFTEPEHLSQGLAVLYATCRSWLMPGKASPISARGERD